MSRAPLGTYKALAVALAFVTAHVGLEYHRVICCEQDGLTPRRDKRAGLFVHGQRIPAKVLTLGIRKVLHLSVSQQDDMHLAPQ